MNTFAFVTGTPLTTISASSKSAVNVRPVSGTSTVVLRRSSFLPITSLRQSNNTRFGYNGAAPTMTLSLDKDEVAMKELMDEKVSYLRGDITEKEVLEAQQLWADGVVKIGSLKDTRAECEAYANQFLDERYAFDLGNVLFKPTKCAVVQFRPTKADAVSYFIGGSNKQHAEDGGFAVTPWTHVRFENAHFLLEGDRAVAMGNYFFTDTSGGVTKVEYTFGYKKVDGVLKIDLHHSSIPFPSPSEK